jgi:hypothetical protein
LFLRESSGAGIYVFQEGGRSVVKRRFFYPSVATAAVLCALCAFALAPPTSHALMTKATVAELTAGSTDIVRGRVQTVVSQWENGAKTIATYASISVEERLKGDGPDVVTVRVPGGQVGDVGLWVEDTPVFAEGQEVIIFLEATDDLSFMQVRGDFQGEFTVEDGKVFGSGLPLVDFVRMVKSIVQTQEKELIQE